MKTAPAIRLSQEEREQLHNIVRAGKHSARVQTRARILLLAAESSVSSRGGRTRRSNSNRTIGEDLLVSARTVSGIRQRFVAGGLKAALGEHERSGRPTEIDGAAEAKLIMLACSQPPDGRSRWTLRLLADRMVALGYTEHISDTWVLKLLKKNKLRPWAIKSWCLPKVSTRFIAKMEDVLGVYQRPYDQDYPMVCLDEKGKELQSQRAELILPKPGQGGSRQDYEYRREGSANILLVCEPLTGWRRVAVSQDRTARTLARQLRQLVEEDFPKAHKIVLVTDNLNIHGIWSLYEEFTAPEARRIADKIEWHYTPEHGSWLNRAELEISAMQRQCLNRRFADLTTLQKECQAWAEARNLDQVKIKWQFSNADARIRLQRLYPQINDKS